MGDRSDVGSSRFAVSASLVREFRHLTCPRSCPVTSSPSEMCLYIRPVRIFLTFSLQHIGAIVRCTHIMNEHPRLGLALGIAMGTGRMLARLVLLFPLRLVREFRHLTCPLRLFHQSYLPTLHSLRQPRLWSTPLSCSGREYRQLFFPLVVV
jgi:hypothetical protein